MIAGVEKQRNHALPPSEPPDPAMLTYGLLGTLLGLSAGLAPGPLLALVISETLRHNLKAGIKVALSPLLTDVPIVGGAIFLLGRVSGFPRVWGVLSLVGALVVLYLAYQGYRVKVGVLPSEREVPRSLLKGTIVNLSNPHPYLFWLSVGAPSVHQALYRGLGEAVAFLCSFYLFLVGVKVLLAWTVHKTKAVLKGRWYVWVHRLLSLFLFLFALKLIREGLVSLL